MTQKEYIREIQAQYATGHAREHSYRPALQNLLQSLLPKHQVTNEPARIACGAPDFIITRGDMPVAFVETKDLFDTDLDGRRQHKEQFTRYRQSLDTVVFTDYLDFHLYEGGEFVTAVRIAEERGGKIVAVEAAWEQFEQLISHLANAQVQKITSASRLAQLMAAKARLLKSSIQEAFAGEAGGADKTQNNELRSYYEAFRTVLIHDLTTDAFADIYAQTIVYGMFAARLHDPTPEDFSRQEAAELIPKSNPFLRKVFQQIAGYDLDTRIAWIVDDLVGTFRAANVAEIMADYQKNKLHTDPLIHFYEDFLAAYDPRLRDQRGVYYTPQPVVHYIVDAVDHILRAGFGLPRGLADHSKIRHSVKNDQKVKPTAPDTYEREMHRVQILDPATGTGTFLSEVIRQIYERYYSTKQGMWQNYVEEHLLPRVHGFELMMAPYAIAHLKMDMTLQQTGYQHTSASRFRIYLTNSLEEYHPDTGTLFGNYLATEATEANYVKRDTPVMVMVGNPPYSVSSSNSGKWIVDLLDDYKKNLNERNIQPLSDDYIKFLRYGHYMIEKNGQGVLAYICNNGFLDGIIHRQMRLKMLETFDDIYILDLHGNSRKKETAPDGGKDDNVFDIMQGVSINIFVKKGDRGQGAGYRGQEAGYRGQETEKRGQGAALTPKSSPLTSELATVHHADLFGKRSDKYATLCDVDFAHTQWQILSPSEPYFFFVPKDFSAQEEYEKGFRIDELMNVNASGVKTHHDEELVSFTPFENEFNQIYAYRPFDNRFINYDVKKVVRHRINVMRHMLQENIGLLACKQAATEKFGYFVSDYYCPLKHNEPGSTH